MQSSEFRQRACAKLAQSLSDDKLLTEREKDPEGTQVFKCWKLLIQGLQLPVIEFQPFPLSLVHPTIPVFFIMWLHHKSLRLYFTPYKNVQIEENSTNSEKTLGFFLYDLHNVVRGIVSKGYNSNKLSKQSDPYAAKIKSYITFVFDQGETIVVGFPTVESRNIFHGQFLSLIKSIDILTKIEEQIDSENEDFEVGEWQSCRVESEATSSRVSRVSSGLSGFSDISDYPFSDSLSPSSNQEYRTTYHSNREWDMEDLEMWLRKHSLQSLFGPINSYLLARDAYAIGNAFQVLIYLPDETIAELIENDQQRNKQNEYTGKLQRKFHACITKERTRYRKQIRKANSMDYIAPLKHKVLDKLRNKWNKENPHL